MPSKYWRQFKSGSDIRGIASDGVPGEKINLTNEVIERIVVSFAAWIANKTWSKYNTMTMAVGTDSRLSALRIKTTVISSLRSIGVNIYDCDLASTPAMLMSVSGLSCTASLEITASHHPSNRNGIKFFTKEGGLSSGDIDEILDLAQSGEVPAVSSDLGTVKSINMMNYYCAKIRSVILGDLDGASKPLKGLKIAVDAGNGVGGFFVENVLNPLGSDTKASVFLNPDGNFPNHAPNPEDGAAIESLSKTVKDSKSDLGIIFDTDVDRVAFVDSTGAPINRDRFVALISAIILQNNPGAQIVTDSVTSDKLSEFIQKLGGVHVRYKRGYRNVIDYAKKLNNSGINCPLAIETSGHAALRENNFIDDGAYLAAKIIREYSKMKNEGTSFEDLLKGFQDAKEQIEVRIPINDPKVITMSRRVLTQLEGYIPQIKSCSFDPTSLEGVRLNFNARWQEGWCLLRQSVHDPELVLNIQSCVRNGATSILGSLAPFLKKFSFLDNTPIEDFLDRSKDRILEPVIKLS